MSKFRMVILLVLVALAVLPVQAQTTPTVNPNANITWPPPVYVVRGSFQVRGTANIAGMSNYFLEFRALGADLQPAAVGGDWFPALLPSAAPVTDGLLGTWDTRSAVDGLYELRLTVNVAGQTPVQHMVSPLRIENVPPPFAATPTPPPAPTALPATVAPTATTDPSPRATIETPQGNLREGDSTVFRIIVTLPQGTSARIVGISNRGTGWYRVQLDDGRLGWWAPEIVSTSGNLSGLPQVAPPPLPAPTAAPLPTGVPATAVPVSAANLVAGVVVSEPASPQCGQTFVIGLDVANLGTQPTTISGSINLVDVRAADGSQQGTTVGGFPVLQPNQTFRVTMPLTISTWYGEVHRITLTIDPANQIAETNEGDNTRTFEYTLEKGTCP